MRVQKTDDRLVIELELPVQVEQAWAALTSPAAVSNWWGEHVHLEPYLGGEFREHWTDAAGREVVTTGVITRSDPPISLETTWRDEDWPAETNVLFALTERNGDQSILRLEHRGWDALAAEGRHRLIDEHTAGWRGHMQSLYSYLQP